jgi:ribosomal protein S18 acetylase RimI-like enzyme
MKCKADDTGLVIREFRMEDYASIIRLWEEGKIPLKPEGRDSPESIAGQIALDNVIFLVAELSGRVVGTVLATHDGRKGWINRLAVERTLRRTGIGRKLVREAESRFEALGFGIVAALIEDWNTESMAVFERLGYRKHPEILYFAKRKFPGV